MEKYDLKKLLGEYFYNKYNLNDKTKYIIEKVPAKKLISSQRLDIISKYMYVLFKDKKIESDLAETIYKDHISIFSEGLFYEPGSETKKNYLSFINEFNLLIDNLKNDNFDPDKSIIPVGYDNSILDGAHRVAISAYYDLDVLTIKFKDIKGAQYDYNYFKKRQLKDEYLDYLILNYMKLKKENLYVVCLWPSATKLNKDLEVEKELNKTSNIIYKKVVKFDYKMMKDFMAQIYGNQKWVGNVNNQFSGVIEKLNNCFANSNINFYFIEGGNLESILKMKENIRKIFNIGKHSIHITDNYDESIQIAELILNSNSLHFLKYSNPFKYIDNTKNVLKVRTKDDDIICGDYTFSLYGLNQNIVTDSIILGQNQISFDIRYDYRNYFYYMNNKFLTPFCANELSNHKYEKEYTNLLKSYKMNILLNARNVLLKIKFKIKQSIIRTLRKIGILEFVSKMMRRNK